MISSLLGLACEAVAAFTVEHVCAVAEVPSGELARTQQLLAGYDPYPRMIQALRNERASFIAAAGIALDCAFLSPACNKRVWIAQYG